MRRAWLAAALWLAPSLASAQEPTEAMTATARELYEAGADAAAASDWQTCHAKLTAAWAVTKHHQVAGQLGMCELELGLHADAAEHLAYYISHAPEDTPAEQKSYARGLYDRAVKEVAVVVCDKSFAGAEVKVDGAGAGSGPVTLYLKPGEHALEADRKGARWSARITFKAGERRELTVTFETQGPPPPPAPEGPSTVIVATGYGVAGVAAGVAIGLTVAAAGKDGEVDDLAGEIQTRNIACPESSVDPTCVAIYDAADARGALSAGAGVAWGIAGAAAIGTTVYWLVGASATESAAIRVEPRAGARGAGIWLRGAY